MTAGRKRENEKPEASTADAEELSFEAALDRLDGLVDRLERGDLELEDALAAFEQGVALTRRCADRLDRAERRIETLMREGETWLTRPFESGEEGE